VENVATVPRNQTPAFVRAALRNGRWHLPAIVGLTVCLVLIGTIAANGFDAPWESPLGRDHPLVGRIWNVTAARFSDPTMLVSRLADARFMLLGEKHDNPDHHRLQAWVLQQLIDAGRQPAVAFEMFTLDDAPAIARYVAARPKDAAGLGQAIDWQHRGWPDWALYQPIADIALRQGLTLVASNLPPATARDISSRGLGALDISQITRLGLDRALSPDTRAAMLEEIRQAHCGYTSDTTAEAMVAVQRARDAQMAERLAAAGKHDGAALIAGAGHVRHDYGVPAYLRAHAPGATVMSLAFLEVSAQGLEATAYAGRFHGTTLPFDYVWFTPRVDDEDPCQKFEEQLKKLRK
jgi:uncharacterized iron-regulated protein